MWDPGVEDEPLFAPGPKEEQGFHRWRTNFVLGLKGIQHGLARGHNDFSKYRTVCNQWGLIKDMVYR